MASKRIPICDPIALPKRNIAEDYGCGAFYNLCPIIGDAIYGVPDVEHIHPREERKEFYTAMLILENYRKRTAPEQISIAQMGAEVERELMENGIKIGKEKFFWV